MYPSTHIHIHTYTQHTAKPECAHVPMYTCTPVSNVTYTRQYAFLSCVECIKKGVWGKQAHSAVSSITGFCFGNRVTVSSFDSAISMMSANRPVSPSNHTWPQ